MSGSPFNRRQIGLLVMVTLFWGLNWPVLKLGVSGYPPLSFRALSMALGLPMLLAACLALKMPLRVASADWRELSLLTLTNMIVWHTLAILAIQSLSSGRAAILGYTMPIFSAVWGVLWFGQRLTPRQGIGVGAAAFAVTLLLWHEFERLTGSPEGVLGMLGAAAAWAVGTQLLRHTRIATPTLVLVWWMSVATTLVMAGMAFAFERSQWIALPPAVWAAVAYNAVLIFGLAQPAWLMLARDLAPAASTLSVMLIPVLGTVSGAWFLNETLYWQDGAALALIGVAIVSVLWVPRRRPTADQPA